MILIEFVLYWKRAEHSLITRSSRLFLCHKFLFMFPRQFDHTLSSVCFATWRGDLFVGLLGHIFCVGIKDFLPPSFLERVIMYEYEDEPKEDATPYDERLRAR